MSNPNIKNGVIDVGSLGQRHARIYAALPGGVLTGVYDPDSARATEIAGKNGCRRFTTIEELGEACEAINIVGPTARHE